MKSREYLFKVFNRFAGLRTWMIKDKKKSQQKKLYVNTNETTTNCTLKKND